MCEIADFDPRVTPARPDLAASHLQGKVDAARFVEGRDYVVAVPQAPVRRRLAYDEFLAGQLSLALVRSRLRKTPGIPIHPTGK